MRTDKHEEISKNLRTGKNVKAFIVLSMILLIAFAGCTAKQTVNTSGEDVKVSQGSGLGPEWCKAGTSVTSSASQGMALIVKGVATYDGKEVCEADAKYDHGGQSVMMTYYYSQDGKYMHMVMKDASGKIMREMDTNAPQ